MKKLLLTLLGVLIALPTFARDFTYEYEGQTLTYTVIDEDAKTCKTKDSSNYVSGDLIIPSIAKDGDTEFTVTSIGNSSFASCTSMTSVIIPNTVTSIGGGAFQYCTRLTEVIIPNSVCEIGRSIFVYCESLKEVIISNSLTTIEYGTFAYSGLTSITIPESVTSIGDKAFEGCSDLTKADFASIEALCKINFGEGDTNPLSFAHNLYINGEEVKEVVIPESVISIGSNAFKGCNGITSVTIPNSVTSIGSNAFKGCNGITSVTIPNSVTSIGSNAFQQCSGLKEVIILSSVISIGQYAFSGCNGLKKSAYPNTLSNPFPSGICVAYNPDGAIIDDGFIFGSNKSAIYYASHSLKGEYSIPSSVISIGEYAFQDCNSLTSVTIPNSVTTIGDYAFWGCSALNELRIGNSVTSIGNYAFSSCTALNELTIGNSVTSISDYAFKNCIALTSVTIPNSITSIGKGVFDKCSALKQIIYLSEDYIDGLVTLINGSPNATFCMLLGMKKKLENYVTGIDIINVKIEVINPYNQGEMGYTFDITDHKQTFVCRIIDSEAKTCSLEGLKNINSGELFSIPSVVKYDNIEYKIVSIGKYAFTPAPNLTFTGEVEIPSSVKTIEPYAFYNNDQIFGVTLSEGLEEIGDFAFAGCKLLESVNFPSTLKTLGSYTYANCSKLPSVTLPTGLTSLGNGVFSGCSSIEKAVLVSDIDTLGENLFNSCSALNKIYFPIELKNIGDYAFLGCIALEEVMFPATLEAIGSAAFAECGLLNVSIPDNVVTIGERAFESNNIKVLTIGKGLEIIPWRAFFNNHIVVINFSEGLKKIQIQAFYSQDLGSVILPSTLTTIEDYAFAESRITELTIPDCVTELPKGSCGYPKVLNIGSGIRSIDNKAFGFDNLRVLRVKSNTPPALNDAFPITDAQNDNLTVIVNNGRGIAYKNNARWKQLDNIIEEGSSDITVFMTGDFTLAEEIRMTIGLMPSTVTKMKVVGPLTATDLIVIKENMVSLLSLDLTEATGVTTIPENQFNGSLLTKISLPRNLTAIEPMAFANCPLLEITNLPDGITSIGEGAFSNSPRIKINVLPMSLETIGNNAFTGCMGISEIIGNEALREIGNAAFKDCSMLEMVDLVNTSISSIYYDTFNGCLMLDEIILPETVNYIGEGAFSGTAIRDLSFIASLPNVTTILDGAFSNCRRLVTATVPENVKNVPADVFSNCPRLITATMPQGTASVGANVLNGDIKFANISCSAVEAPAAGTDAFNGIRLRYVSLTVPATSFRSYLNAPQWGKFQSIQNSIVVTIDEGVDVTNVNEDEYQEMLEEDELEEVAEEAAQGNEEPNTPEVKAMISRRADHRSASRAATQNGENFAALFNGARIQASNDTEYIRVFVNPKEGVNIISILVNGVEKLGTFEGNSFLIPANSSGTLVITTDKPTSVNEISNDTATDAIGEVYNLNGNRIATSTDNLAPGIYIVRQGNAVKKIIVK